MKNLFSPIQKIRKKVQDSSFKYSSATLFSKMKFGFLNKKALLIASGIGVLTVPAAFAMQSHFDTTPTEPSAQNTSVNTNVSTNPSSTPDPAPTPDPTSSSTTITGNNSGISGNVTVNGQTIPLPANGTVNKTITTDGPNTNVQLDIHSNASNSSSTHTSVHSSSNSSTSGTTNTNIFYRGTPVR